MKELLCINLHLKHSMNNRSLENLQYLFLMFIAYFETKEVLIHLSS